MSHERTQRAQNGNFVILSFSKGQLPVDARNIMEPSHEEYFFQFLVPKLYLGASLLPAKFHFAPNQTGKTQGKADFNARVFPKWFDFILNRTRLILRQAQDVGTFILCSLCFFAAN